jgi:hypothetical protein
VLSGGDPVAHYLLELLGRIARVRGDDEFKEGGGDAPMKLELGANGFVKWYLTELRGQRIGGDPANRGAI